MSKKPDKIQIHIKYKDADKTIEGTAEETWLLLCKFFNEFIPTYEVANKLWLNVNIQSLAKDCYGLIVFSPEGANVLASKNKLTDNETLGLWLLAAHLGHKLNLLSSDVMSKEELQEKLGKNGKITSTRLGEMIKTQWISKTNGDMYRITTFGIAKIQKDIIPRVKTKINGN